MNINIHKILKGRADQPFLASTRIMGRHEARNNMSNETEKLYLRVGILIIGTVILALFCILPIRRLDTNKQLLWKSKNSAIVEIYRNGKFFHKIKNVASIYKNEYYFFFKLSDGREFVLERNHYAIHEILEKGTAQNWKMLERLNH